MNLLDSLSDKQHAELKTLRCIDQWDFSRVKGKVQTDLHGIASTYLDSGIEHLKRYYALAAIEPKRDHAVSQPVDPFWHAHILFSRDYASFCRKTFGRYLHHEPLNTADSKAISHIREVYERTLASHALYFNEIDEAWWPAADAPNALQCGNDPPH